MPEKVRLDAAVLEKGFAESREKAKAYIMAGQVYVNNQKADKAGLLVRPDDVIEFRGSRLKYVSRGGLKLEKAMETFGFGLRGKIAADIGASTGGFTDCMLQNGASRVYAVDVGYGQLAWKLRTDARVVNLERTNFRYVTEKEIPEKLQFVSIDVSFISLSLILPALSPLLAKENDVACLIKPQFEAGKEKVGKKGVVRDPATHREVIERVTAFMLEEGFSIFGITFSPITGPEGNIEYLAHLRREEHPAWKTDVSIPELVEESHRALKGGEAS